MGWRAGGNGNVRNPLGQGLEEMALDKEERKEEEKSLRVAVGRGG